MNQSLELFHCYRNCDAVVIQENKLNIPIGRQKECFSIGKRVDVWVGNDLSPNVMQN